MRNYFFVLTLILFGASINAQDVEPRISPFENAKAQDERPTVEEKGTVWIKLKKEGLEELQNVSVPLVNLVLELPGEGLVELTLLESCPFPDNIPVGKRVLDAEGDVVVKTSYHNSELKTFDITGGGIGGSIIIFKNQVLASIRYNGRVFELRPVDLHKSLVEYVLFDINDSKYERDMSCATDELVRKVELRKTPVAGEQKSLNIECVEIAIDIDYYTYNTFGNCDDAISWALAILAGVDEIYRTSLNDVITLQASYINIWQTTDPYAAYVEDAGGMLDELRNTWLADNILSSSNHDLVHLMSKRGNTGTGGIAWIDGVCNNYGFGFSSYMDNQTSFSIPNYSWNLNVVGHELGHNFGSNHTHWCGWPGGPIDNCGDLEGPCSGYTNNPQGQLGTMMSYCHAISGGSVTLEFHETVASYALIPSLNAATCHNNCAGIVTSCGSVYGCTDPSACNYNPNASQDDGSCGDFDVCGVCAGNGTSCTGCTDPEACNYAIEATIDDNSCVYPPTGYECDCETSVNVVASLAASASAETVVEATGVFTGISISLDFVNTTGGGSWGGDILVEVISPSGDCIAIGGYDVISM
jgi:hypothetical protein